MKTEQTSPIIVSEDLQKQREFISKIHERNFDFGIVISEAFVRGMRDLGYKSTGTALDELIDNAIQAEASQVHVVFGYYENNKSQKKPNIIAIIDNGHGMDPDMIRIASIWGGTHREDDRKGFGRYGYGLPSASVSIGRQFQVFSKVIDGNWHQVTIDVDDIGEGKYLDNNGKVVVPLAVKTKLPEWIRAHIDTSFKGFNHGTVIVIDKIDRLDYSTTNSLRDFLLQHFGITYRNYLRNINVFVDGTKVEGIDPLFTTPGLRYFNEDDERAQPLPDLTIDVKDKETQEIKGVIKVRYSLMAPTFLRKPEYKLKPKDKRGNNSRFNVRKENNGIIVLRAGRQIDVINPPREFTTFQNNDRYLGIEVDFPPVLDEEFSITTSKQQVVLKEGIWDKLKDNGLFRNIAEMRTQYKKALKELEDKIKKETGKGELHRAEDAMIESKKYITTKPETPKQQDEKQKNLEKEAKERAETQGRSFDDVKKEVEFETHNFPYKVVEVDVPEGSPFYWSKQIGGQLTVYINKNHRFYTDIYAAPMANEDLKDALKVLLYVYSECELSASEEIQNFYSAERFEWSKRLNLALRMLSQWQNNEDNKVWEEEIKFSEQNN